MEPDTRVIVEVHDVSASRAEGVAAILTGLDRIGARPRVLLVVPAGLSDSSELVRLLTEEVAGGSEIVMHGFDHRARGRFAGRPLDVLRARLFSPADAEFLALDRDEAKRRLLEGRAQLARLGLDVEGFCAPGWLEPPWLPRLLRELDFRYDVGMSVLRDLRRGTSRRLPWVGEVGAGRAHEALVALGGAAAKLVAGQAPLKVFFHARHEATVDARVLTILERELRRRRSVCYSTLLAH